MQSMENKLDELWIYVKTFMNKFTQKVSNICILKAGSVDCILY